MHGIAVAFVEALPGIIQGSGLLSWLTAGLLLTAGPAIAAAEARAAARADREFAEEFAALAEEYLAGARARRRR